MNRGKRSSRCMQSNKAAVEVSRSKGKGKGKSIFRGWRAANASLCRWGRGST